MKQWWLNWLTNNQRFTKENSDYRRIVILNVLLSLMVIILTIYPIINFIYDEYLLAFIELGGLLLAISVLIFFKATHKIVLTSYLCEISFLFVLTVILVVEKNQEYIFMWSLLVPAISYFILGRISGTIITIGYLAFIIVFMSLNIGNNSGLEPVHYFSNIIGSYIAVSVIIRYFEFSRMDTLGELRKINADLRALSETDKLTGIYNRLKLDDVLEEEIGKAEISKKPLSVIMIDIDDFKLINDRYGHLVGDSVLTQAAYVLKKDLDVDQVIGRWGGEEFLIICPHTDIERATDLAFTLRKMIESIPFDGKIRFTISLGISSWIKGDTIETLIKKADQALYSAKNRGKNQAINQNV